MTCPFTAARLHELHHAQHWTPAQIAVLASATTDTAVDAALVLEWLRQAGIETRGPQPPHMPRAAPAKPRRGPAQNRASFPCEQCGTTLWRTPGEVKAHMFCSRTCCREWRKEQSRLKRGVRKCLAGRDLTLPKRCPGCGVEKTLAEFNLDVRRPDGRFRICRPCENAKSKSYYERHRARLQDKARERKREERARGKE